MEEFLRTLRMALLPGLLLFCTDAVFAEGPGLYGIGGRLSFTKPENIDATPGFGLHADLGTVLGKAVFFPSIEYWKKSEGGEGRDASVSGLQLNADAKYLFSGRGNLHFFAGGGLALIFNSVSIDYPGIPSLPGSSIERDETNTRLGLNLFGGVDLPVSSTLEISGMVEFNISDIDVFRLTGGLTYRFRK